jgi:hypothetical protein
MSFTGLLAEYYDEPYLSKRDEFIPFRVINDSSGVPLFLSFPKYAKCNPKDKSLKIIDSVMYGNQYMSIVSASHRNGHFGQKLLMLQLFANDSIYMHFESNDTSILINLRYFSSNLFQFNSTTYSNGKFWFGGLWNYLYRFDEETFEIDSIAVDSLKLYPWALQHRRFMPYKNGILYISQVARNLHYYSDEEQWTVALDSIAKANYKNWGYIQHVDYFDGKVMLSIEGKAIYIYDINQKTLEEINLDNTIVSEKYKTYVDSEGNLLLEFFANYDCKGNIFFSLESNKEGFTLYKIDEKREISEFKLDGFVQVFDVTRTGRNSNWIRGFIGDFEDGTQTFKVVEHFPDGTGVEGAPPTLLPINVYPNPSKSYTNVKFYLQPSTKASLKCSIYNYMGSLIAELDNEIEYDETTGFATKRIETGSLNTGIYYLLVDNGSEKRLFGFAVE